MRKLLITAAVLAASVAATGAGAGAAGASASPEDAVAVATASPAIDGGLVAVSASSATDAWAVGSDPSRTAPYLTEHWNGRTWIKVPVSVPGPEYSGLAGVTDISSTDAWAVGSDGSTALILHWNGKKWSQVPVPSIGASGKKYNLSSVSGLSATDAWAVGSAGSSTLILHWNGTAWKRVPSPSPESHASLDSVAVSSAGSAWAVGSVTSGISGYTLIEHWNGKLWTRVPSPDPDVSEGLTDSLSGVTVIPGGGAWATGDASCGCGPGSNLTLRWSGTAWKQVPSPTPEGGVFLPGVVAVSARTAWAVGETSSAPFPSFRTVILQWNGTAWKRVPSPSPGASAGLRGIAAISAADAWAVGDISAINGSSSETLILHWNGTSWKRS
jgi:hypothetical protein